MPSLQILLDCWHGEAQLTVPRVKMTAEDRFPASIGTTLILSMPDVRPDGEAWPPWGRITNRFRKQRIGVFVLVAFDGKWEIKTVRANELHAIPLAMRFFIFRFILPLAAVCVKL